MFRLLPTELRSLAGRLLRDPRRLSDLRQHHLCPDTCPLGAGRKQGVEFAVWCHQGVVSSAKRSQPVVEYLEEQVLQVTPARAACLEALAGVDSHIGRGEVLQDLEGRGAVWVLRLFDGSAVGRDAADQLLELR